MSEAKRIQIKIIEDGKEIISAEGRDPAQEAPRVQTAGERKG